MKPEISDKVEVNKTSTTLGIRWEHEVIEDDCFDKPEVITLKNTHLFTLLKSNSATIRLCIISDLPSEICILLTHGSSSASIRFQNISKVLYNPKLKLIIFESKESENYSQIRVSHDGHFDLSTSNPNSNYKSSWLMFMAENLGLTEFKP